jgi:valyl-tRNA synthetase
VFAGEELDTEEAERRRQAKVESLRKEIERAESKLANEGFVNKAPPDVVEAEREKLRRYRRELEELGG